MRAMILAAGLGTRLRPLTALRAKPALPIRGRPVISLLLDFLSRHEIREVMINLHYLPHTIRAAVDADRPPSMRIIWSEESEPLGTGGGIRRASEFLSGDDECVVLAGDMLIDIDLTSLLESHRQSGLDATLVLRDDAVYAIAMEDGVYPIVTGATRSTDFPTTVGVVDPDYNASFDIFVTKFNDDGSTVLWSTYLGGSADDRGCRRRAQGARIAWKSSRSG